MRKIAFVEIGEDLLLVSGTMFMVITALSFGCGGTGHHFLSLYLSLFLIGLCELVKIGRKKREGKEKHQGDEE